MQSNEAQPRLTIRQQASAYDIVRQTSWLEKNESMTRTSKRKSKWDSVQVTWNADGESYAPLLALTGRIPVILKTAQRSRPSGVPAWGIAAFR
jgi:hypothetical protein